MPTRWETILADHPRIIVCGRSGVGKTSLARLIPDKRPVFSTDYQRLGGQTPNDLGFVATAYYWRDRLINDLRAGPYLLEGTQAVRVVRTMLRDRDQEPDAVVIVDGRFEAGDLPTRELSDDEDEAENEKRRNTQISRAKGHNTSWEDYLLIRRHKDAKAVIYGGIYHGELVEFEEGEIGAERPNLEADPEDDADG